MAKRKQLKIPPVLFSKTQKIVREIESRTERPFMAYWNSSSGSVCQNDVVGFYEILQKVGKQDNLALFIKSDGGEGEASLRIVNLVRQYCQHLVACVPLDCASAATMLALGADEIQMGPLAYLTAVDTSITHDLSPVDKDNDLVSVSQDELNRIVTMWRTQSSRDGGDGDPNPYVSLYAHIHPLVLGAVDRASSLSVRLCIDIMRFHMAEEQDARRISETLNREYPSHSYPIILSEAQRLGLKATSLDLGLNDLLLELNELYSEMGQKAVTDYDERNYHNNNILNILECADMQIYYQVDKDWHYRLEERTWVSMNDDSSWRKIEKVDGKPVGSVLHIR
jgi:hypothetical protein